MKKSTQQVNRVVAFIDTGGAAPDPFGHSKDEKRAAAITLLNQYLTIDIMNEWALKLLKSPHYQACITWHLNNKCPDWKTKGFVSAFAHGFLDLQFSKRWIANSYVGRKNDK